VSGDIELQKISASGVDAEHMVGDVGGFLIVAAGDAGSFETELEQVAVSVEIVGIELEREIDFFAEAAGERHLGEHSGVRGAQIGDDGVGEGGLEFGVLMIERDGFFGLLDGLVPALEGGGDFGHFVPALRVVGIGLETLGENWLGAFVMAALDESGGRGIGGVEWERKCADEKGDDALRRAARGNPHH